MCRGDSDGCNMTTTIRRRLPSEDKPLPPGMISVEGTAYSVGDRRPDVLEEIVRRAFFWRKERLGVGLPPRR